MTPGSATLVLQGPPVFVYKLLSECTFRGTMKNLFVCLFVALNPMSTAMVIAGRSVHLTTLFPGQA